MSAFTGTKFCQPGPFKRRAPPSAAVAEERAASRMVVVRASYCVKGKQIALADPTCLRHTAAPSSDTRAGRPSFAPKPPKGGWETSRQRPAVHPAQARGDNKLRKLDRHAETRDVSGQQLVRRRSAPLHVSCSGRMADSYEEG